MIEGFGVEGAGNNAPEVEWVVEAVPVKTSLHPSPEWTHPVYRPLQFYA